MKTENLLTGLLRAVVALLAALILGGIVIAVAQKDISAPIRAYQALFVGAVGSPLAWSNTLSRTMPILLTGVGV
ncbi:MAG: ABC transporter permease, partial [Akkermansiaceae bacterium]|nr:ABC transporter permease [Armatimonadota bacterium]